MALMLFFIQFISCFKAYLNHFPVVFPEVTVNPESKIRIENRTMTLCCAGTGKPTPVYEW